jgi:hypothetical protein
VSDEIVGRPCHHSRSRRGLVRQTRERSRHRVGDIGVVEMSVSANRKHCGSTFEKLGALPTGASAVADITTFNCA